MTIDRTPVALALLGGAMVLNGVALGAPTLVDGAETFSETASSWQFAAFNQVYLLVLVGLALLVPSLGGLRSADGVGLSRRVLGLVSAAIVLQAGTVFVQAFVAPFLADVAPTALDTEAGGLLMVSMSVVWVIFTVAVVALGLSAYRRQVFPRPATVLIILGGLLIPMFGPIGSALIGVGFVWSGTAIRRPVPMAADPAPALG